MASLPLIPASWRRIEQTPTALPPPTQAPTQPSTAGSSQPILLANPPPQDPSSSSASNSSVVPRAAPAIQSGAEERRCWICQGDANEDETPREWRSPCPCSLTAHNSCLLEWVSSEEAPKNGELAGATRAIVCPQCKVLIKIERPFDPLVVYTEHIQRAAKILILPTALSAVVGCFYSGFLVYGVNTLHIVFGEGRATQIMLHDRFVDSSLSPQWQSYGLILRDLVRSMDPFFPTADKLSKTNWKLFVGLPFIAPSLVLMRLNLGERIFNLIPTAYFVTNLAFSPGNGFNALEWPPKPSLAFAVLPYVRSFYNELYRVTFADLEKKWDAAVQRRPRDGETAEQIAAEAGQGGVGPDVDLIWGGAEDDEGPAADAPLQADPVPAPPGPDEDEWIDDEDDDDDDDDDDDGDMPELLPLDAVPIDQPAPGEGPGAAPRNRNRNRELRADFTSVTASTIMGALFFPAISSAMGDILAATLPSTWVSGISKVGPRGLLREKWGRTIVGGCLFVVLKDALVLYCKWKKARDFGKLKILDFVGERGRPAA